MIYVVTVWFSPMIKQGCKGTKKFIKFVRFIKQKV